MFREPEFFDVSEMLCCGVYVLLRKNVVVYVGQSRKMLKRIYTHDNTIGHRSPVGYKRKTKGISFDEVHVRPCKVEELDALEQILIAKYQPRYNVQHKGTPRAITDLGSIVTQIMTHRKIASPLAEPRPQIDRRGR